MPRGKKGENHIRKHVTTACIPCRRTKVKCDGNTPTCGNCECKGKECSYRQREDKRTIPLRIAVNLLAKRVGSLSRYLRDRDLVVPAMDEEDQRNLKNIFRALGLDYEEIESGCHTLEQAENISDPDHHPTGPPEPASNNQGDVAHDGSPDFISAPSASPSNLREPVTFSTNLGLDATAEVQEDTILIDHDSSIPLFANGIQVATSPINLPPSLRESECDTCDLQQDEVICDDPPNTEAEEEFTSQLSWRLGRLQLTQDGRFRYFGSTSNLTLLDALVGVNFPNSNNAQKDAREVLENSHLDIDIHDDLEKNLLELYFAWQNPSLYLVDYETFWKARQQNRHEGTDSPYYSRSLVDAMCAIGAAYVPKYHPELVTFPRTLSEFFGERARALLECELETSLLSTVQTLGILSNHEASSTRDTRGWLYSGMAMRLAYDLGLHLDMTSYVEKGIISTEECNLRRTIFWAVYLNEQFWGYYLGRSVPSPNAGVTVQKPRFDDSHLMGRWKPYGCSQVRVEEIYNPRETICHLWVSLYDLMIPLTDVLYGCSEVSNHALQELTATTVARLYEWKSILPQGLDVNTTQECGQYLPHVLILHMQYHQFMIHCHRPYISKHYIQPQPPQGPGSSHARKMCIESAISIVKILTFYESLYGFRKANVQMVSFVFSAALILIFITVPSQSSIPNKEHTRYLSTCFWALDEMGYCFENSKRTSTFLSTLQQQWHKRRKALAEKSTKRFHDSHRQSGQGIFDSRNQQNSQEYSEHDQPRPSRQASNAVGLEPPASYWTQEYTSASDEAFDMVDFMDPDLCNILLSEGIPRALI